MKTDTLTNIVQNIRFELGNTSGLTQGVAELPGIKYRAKRVQEQLYEVFNWPHMIIESDVNLVAGTRYYDWDAPLNRDRVLSVHVKWSQAWTPIEYGFDTTIYNSSMPEETYQVNPVRFWRFHNTDQFEVWPTPADVQILRFRCMKALGSFTSDSDVSDLDANLITLFAAAEIAAQRKSSDAESKNNQAQALLTKIKGQMQDQKPFVYGSRQVLNSFGNYQLYGRKI
jgi:hypothetical protein